MKYPYFGAVLSLALLIGLRANYGLAGQAALDRGAYVVNVLAACASCHTPRAGGAYLSGGTKFGSQDTFVYSANITPDVETGIGSWSDQQIADAIRNGIRPDGTHIGAPMPQTAYRGVSDQDLAAIIEYLRNVPPARNAVQRSTHQAASNDVDHPRITAVSEPRVDNEADKGAYIANALSHCTECHTNASALSPAFAELLNQGGKRFRAANGFVVAPNITKASLNRFTDDEVVALITRGLRPDGSKLEGPMPVGSYAGMKAADVNAIIAYLRR